MYGRSEVKSRAGPARTPRAGGGAGPSRAGSVRTPRAGGGAGTSRAVPVRTLGPFGRWARSDVLRPEPVLSRLRALRVDRPEDSDFAEAESCGEGPGYVPGGLRIFFAPCRWGSGGKSG